MLSELDQHPLIISAIVSCIIFWLHVMQSNDSSLIYKAYWEQCNTSNSTWLNFVKNALCDSGFSHVFIEPLIQLHCYYVSRIN